MSVPQRVLILGGKPVLTRPIPAATVLEALPRACEIDPVLCGRVRRVLKRYMQETGVEFASVEGSVSNGAKTVMPNQHGQTEQNEHRQTIGGVQRLHHSAHARKHNFCDLVLLMLILNCTVILVTPTYRHPSHTEDR